MSQSKIKSRLSLIEKIKEFEGFLPSYSSKLDGHGWAGGLKGGLTNFLYRAIAGCHTCYASIYIYKSKFIILQIKIRIFASNKNYITWKYHQKQKKSCIMHVLFSFSHLDALCAPLVFIKSQKAALMTAFYSFLVNACCSLVLRSDWAYMLTNK